MNDPGVITFINEARELLEDMESALLACEHGQASNETINAIFRAAHTIKGSSGLFGLDVIVSFTHVVESALDRVRNGEVTLDPPLAATLIECKDHLARLVEAVASGAALDEPALEARGEALIVKLHQLSFGVIIPENAEVSLKNPPAACCSEAWHISVRFGPDVLRNGMDPLSFLRYLTTFGELLSVQIVADRLPPPAEMDPLTCYVGYEIRYRTTADKARIEGAFEFVRDDCTLRIVPPRAQLSEFVRLLHDTPEAPQLGEMLVRCGSLTQHELESALRLQKTSAGPDTGPQPLGHILIEQRAVHPALVEAALEKQREVREHKSGAGEHQSIRVDAAKLEKLINLVGELIIAGASTQLIARSVGLAALNESTSKLSRLVEEIRDHALQLRMVQIGATFNRFQRIVRDVARELGKNIRLEVTGAETELDKTLIEQINDPLMHLVRNAIDHGVEDAATRAARGKSPEGVVRLNAYHDSGAVVIEVSDDGGGLDRERILAKARERGLIGESQTMTDREVYALIFEPGFSTAEQVTNLSGRGVGMDVVRRNVAALRGSVDVDSSAGQGTTVRVRLPLTLAIIEGFLVRVGRSALVIPLALVEECVEMADSELSRTGGHHLIDLRGEALPYIRLREAFNLSGAAARRESIVVVRDGHRRMGLVVDELLGELQTVIKPLSKLFKRVRGVGGSTILGSGEVALILDIPGLLEATLGDAAEAVKRSTEAV